MFDWNKLIISKIGLAIFVPPNAGSTIHNNRPYHGLVFNRKGKTADYEGQKQHKRNFCAGL